LFALMKKAKDAILFLVFLPSGAGKQSIIETAIEAGKNDRSLLVLGAVSSSMAMPTDGSTAPAATKTPAANTLLINSRRKAGTHSAGTANKAAKGKPAKPKVSPVFSSGSTEVVLASALNPGDLVGEFEAELLSAGNAIIHDK